MRYGVTIFLLVVSLFSRNDATIQINFYDEVRINEAKIHFQFVIDYLQRSRKMKEEPLKLVKFVFNMPLISFESKEIYRKMIEPFRCRSELLNAWEDSFEYLLNEGPILHNAEAWLIKKESQHFFEKRLASATIYEQTKAACINGFKVSHDLSEEIHWVKSIEKMQQGTLLKNECSSLKEAGIHTMVIEVRNEDTIQSAKRLLDEKLRPVALNFANKDQAGGGVIRGAHAQEEELFRRSTYCFGLNMHYNAYLKMTLSNAALPHYKIPEFGLIYTPSVEVLRGPESEGYPFIQPFEVDFIASAAYDLSAKTDDTPKINYKKNMKEKIRNILRLAVETDHDAIVLGAFGCGAFKNSPKKVAKMFKEVILEAEFQGHFTKITFAIVDGKGSDNYSTFKEILGYD